MKNDYNAVYFLLTENACSMSVASYVSAIGAWCAFKFSEYKFASLSLYLSPTLFARALLSNERADQNRATFACEFHWLSIFIFDAWHAWMHPCLALAPVYVHIYYANGIFNTIYWLASSRKLVSSECVTPGRCGDHVRYYTWISEFIILLFYFYFSFGLKSNPVSTRSSSNGSSITSLRWCWWKHFQ